MIWNLGLHRNYSIPLEQKYLLLHINYLKYHVLLCNLGRRGISYWERVLVHEYVFVSHSDRVLLFFHEADNRVTTLDVLNDFW